MSKRHHMDYDEVTTARSERALVTLLGDIGPWSQRVYLAGGLAPRYIVGTLSEGGRPHVGTTDVDLVIGLAVEGESSEAYRTLENNLKKSGFEAESSFRWLNKIEGSTVIVEFLCETDKVEPGRIFKPKEKTGSGLGAFNVRGAQLVTRDYVEREIEAEVRRRRDGAPPGALFGAMRRSKTRLLSERFADADQDGPHAYGAFLSDAGDDEKRARLHREAVAVVRDLLAAMR